MRKKKKSTRLRRKKMIYCVEKNYGTYSAIHACFTRRAAAQKIVDANLKMSLHRISLR